MQKPPAPLRHATRLAVVLLLFSLPAAAQLQVSRSIVASGGTEMGSAGYSVRATVGQAATGSLQGENTSAAVGYWSSPEISTTIEDTPGRPQTFSLEQNYPNPFNPATTIRFALPRQSSVRLRVFDVSGSLVTELVNEVRPAGVYDERFDASFLASGIYFYRIEAEGFVRSRKFVLLK